MWLITKFWSSPVLLSSNIRYAGFLKRDPKIYTSCPKLELSTVAVAGNANFRSYQKRPTIKSYMQSDSAFPRPRFYGFYLVVNKTNLCT